MSRLLHCIVLLMGIAWVQAVMAPSAAKQPLPAPARIPVGQSSSVEFFKIYEHILSEAGINYEMHNLPTARKRRLFVEGKIVVDCCAAVEWRTMPEEIATQLNSDVFIHSQEHYFFHEDSTIQITNHEDLKNYSMAKVRGFVFKNHEHFSKVVEARSIDEMMRLVALKRADYGLLNPYDFHRRTAINPLPLKLGGVHESSELVIRVHKSRADLLPKINAAIAKVKADGTFDALLPPYGSPE